MRSDPDNDSALNEPAGTAEEARQRTREAQKAIATMKNTLRFALETPCGVDLEKRKCHIKYPRAESLQCAEPVLQRCPNCGQRRVEVLLGHCRKCMAEHLHVAALIDTLESEPDWTKAIAEERVLAAVWFVRPTSDDDV